jgi:hypothetical protein
MRGGAALLILVVAAASVAACGTSRRSRVDDYIKSANAIEARAAPEFDRANTAYKRFSKNKLAKSAAADVATAERSIRSTRTELAGLHPPPDARRLHRLLLRLFDLNASIAHETTQLAVYLPAATTATGPLTAINKRLQDGLRSTQVPKQTQALTRYGSELGGVVAALKRLDPPPLLASVHRDQVTRLESTRSLARELSGAITAQDGPRVAKLLARFQTLRSQAGRQDLAGRALRAYERRYREIALASQAVQREHNRIELALR